jgi:glyoxylase-like metal-dependent hydrolase (beta-lactamase superfamily II)
MTMKVGEIEILPVLDGTILSQLPASKAFPDEGSDAWREQHGMFRGDGLIESSVGAFLVRAGDRLALVDAGAGQEVPGGYAPPVIDVADDDDPFVSLLLAQGTPRDHLPHVIEHFSRGHIERGALPESLRELGVELADITDVILSHLHFDHIGWVSADGAPYFPNATIRCASADLDFFLEGPGIDQERFISLVFRTPVAPERFAPVLDRVEAWDTDCTLFPGVDVRLAPGHTPGSSVVVVSDGDERVMMLGDMVHCPLELQDDDFNMLVDIDADLAARTREAYARELEGDGIPAAASHFPGLQFGRLLPGTGVRHWTFDSY